MPILRNPTNKKVLQASKIRSLLFHQLGAMQPLQIIIAILVASGSSFEFSIVLPNIDQWFVPDSNNGSQSWITRSAVLKELKSMVDDQYLVQYHLYTQNNPKSSQVLILGDLPSLYLSNYNADHPTRIIVHGFKTSYDSPVCTLIRDAYLKKGPHNIICVNWDKIANKLYPTARYSAPSVGKDLGLFIRSLGLTDSIPQRNLIVIGHSLGAHIAGFAGKLLKIFDSSIPVIVGCDPALPLFHYEDCTSRLCKTDAGFVESIQTNGGKLGILRPVGSGAYYPNGGVVQPGCGIDLTGSCAHSRSYMYFAEAIALNDFPTVRCGSYLNAVLAQCGRQYSSVRMGSLTSFRTSGIFYVPVNSNATFGKGT